MYINFVGPPGIGKSLVRQEVIALIGRINADNKHDLCFQILDSKNEHSIKLKKI